VKKNTLKFLPDVRKKEEKRKRKKKKKEEEEKRKPVLSNLALQTTVAFHYFPY